MNTQPLYDKLGHYLKKKHLKSTKQRTAIIKAFFAMEGRHSKIEELFEVVRKENPAIGYATVYRTLLLLVEAGVALHRHFNDGMSTFEINSAHHHDHLICTECNKIVEFENNTIENLQVQIAKKYRFILTGHKMELYGLCPNCQKKRKNDLNP